MIFLFLIETRKDRRRNEKIDIIKRRTYLICNIINVAFQKDIFIKLKSQ